MRGFYLFFPIVETAVGDRGAHFRHEAVERMDVVDGQQPQPEDFVA